MQSALSLYPGALWDKCSYFRFNYNCGILGICMSFSSILFQRKTVLAIFYQTNHIFDLFFSLQGIGKALFKFWNYFSYFSVKHIFLISFHIYISRGCHFYHFHVKHKHMKHYLKQYFLRPSPLLSRRYISLWSFKSTSSTWLGQQRALVYKRGRSQYRPRYLKH